MKALLVRVADYVLGCRHPQDKRSWPRVNLKRGSRGVYKTCLLCGKEIPYHNPELISEAAL